VKVSKVWVRPAILHYIVLVLTLDLLRQLTQLSLLAHFAPGLHRNVGSPPIARSEIPNARPLSPAEGAPQSNLYDDLIFNFAS